LGFAWRVVKHVKSNAIVLARGKRTVGVGAGQMSRVESVRIACAKAGEGSEGAVLASDAFFPFPDGLELALTRGVVLTQGDVLTVDTLPISLDDEEGEPVEGKAEEAVASAQSAPPQAQGELPSLREIERRHIVLVLQHTHWNKRRTCSILQITRPTLDRKIKEFRLEKPSSDAPTPMD